MPVCPICAKVISTPAYMAEHRLRAHTLREHHLYMAVLVGAPGSSLVKVGRSADPYRRLRELESGMPFRLEMYAVWENCGDFETAVHRALSPYRAQGTTCREWYSCHPEVAHASVQLLLAPAGRLPRPAASPSSSRTSLMDDSSE